MFLELRPADFVDAGEWNVVLTLFANRRPIGIAVFLRPQSRR
jgi:hypothetical protein